MRFILAFRMSVKAVQIVNHHSLGTDHLTLIDVPAECTVTVQVDVSCPEVDACIAQDEKCGL